MQDILRRLGRRIRELRIERGFTSQESFADYCKMHRTYLGHLETGRKDFRLTSIIRVADALGVTLSELFAGLEPGEPTRIGRNIRRSRVDQYGVLKELATMERSIQALKKLASPRENPAKRKPRRRGGPSK